MADDSNVTKAVSNGIAPPPFQLPVCIYAMRFSLAHVSPLPAARQTGDHHSKHASA